MCARPLRRREKFRACGAHSIVYTHISDLTNSAEKEVLDGDNSARKMVLDNLI